VPYAVRDQHFADAQRPVQRFAFDHRLRSLDAIQLAVACDLRARGPGDYLVTADLVFHQVATEMGFAAINPQHPSICNQSLLVVDLQSLLVVDLQSLPVVDLQSLPVVATMSGRPKLTPQITPQGAFWLPGIHSN